jgi:hypothetical protein
MKKIKWMRYIGQALALIWAGWWIFFGVASGMDERLNLLGILIHATIPGLIFLVSAIIAWQWQVIGSIVLILEGLLIFIVYPVMFRHLSFLTIILTLLTLALPPLIAGFLLLVSWRKLKTMETS